MLSDSLDSSTDVINVPKRVFAKIKPDEPLKDKIEDAQRMLQPLIGRLNVKYETLRKRDGIFCLTK